MRDSNCRRGADKLFQECFSGRVSSLFALLSLNLVTCQSMLENLSEYEQVRLSNIKRNEDYLKSLGLANVKEIVKDTTFDEVDGDYHPTRHKKLRKTSEKYSEHAPILRRSTRGNGVQEENPINFDSKSNVGKKSHIVDDQDDFEMPEPLPLSEITSGTIQISAQDLLGVLLASNPEHAKMIKNSVSSYLLCIRATHCHCHNRVRKILQCLTIIISYPFTLIGYYEVR
jgi:hypothetical protein